jgi:phosphatidylglycerophosphate synthase
VRRSSSLQFAVNRNRVESVLRTVYRDSMMTVMATALPRAEQQQAAGAGVQVALLAALSAGAGLGPVGWLAGIGYTLGLWAWLSAAVWRAGVSTLGPADLVTLVRAVLVGGVAALVTDGLWHGATPAAQPGVAALVGTATVALVLDAVDGRVARRSGTASALGARFDMEVDAFLLLVLSVHVAALMGPWVLAIGAMRYAFVAAGWVAPWLGSALPTRYSAKVVAAVQGIVLVVAAGEVLPRSLAVALVATALVLLVWSFGHDVAWLWRNARPRRAPAGPAGAPAAPLARPRSRP